MTQEDKTTVWQDWFERVSLEEISDCPRTRKSPTGRRQYGVPPFPDTSEMRAWVERDTRLSVKLPDPTSHDGEGGEA